ncbi:hypothetical protein Tco_0779989 [Tanacetum coccineum]
MLYSAALQSGECYNDVQLNDIPIICDNKGAIDLSKNPVQHSQTKHIEIRHYFLRDNVQKGHISIKKLPSVNNIADILLKPLKRESFNYLHFAQIIDIRCEGACVFTDKWSLDELAYGVPSDSSYQTNPPSPDDIISSIQIDREGQSYVLYNRVMNPLTAQQERKTRKDLGTRRGRHSTSSSSAFDQPSSSHLNDDDDGNNEGTLRASTLSPIRYVNSLANEVPQVFQNPPNIHLEPFYTRQTEIINRQVQIRDEHRSGLRSIEKGLRNLWRNMRK